MPNKITTIFQNLDRAINGNWEEPHKHVNSYDMSGNAILYTAQDKESYAKKKLELQQNAYLGNMWRKANVDMTVQAFSGLNNIKLMYRDAELMDSFPEIGAALDIVSEECCVLSPKNEIVTVSSKSERIKSILDDLFTNRLDLHITAPMIIRAMCKYGNQFMLLNVDNKMGVTGWKQLPVYNIERLENGIENPYSAVGLINGNQNGKKDMSTKFVWMDAQNSSQVEFRNWQIGHFRLLTDSLYLPYGCLVGDTRVETEYGYKEIKNISIGDKVWTFNVDKRERELSTVTMMMNKGVKDVFKLSTKHHSIEATEDHKFLCVNNDVLTYKELKDIQVGDYVVVNKQSKTDCKSIVFDKSELKDYEKGKKSLKWWYDYIDNIPTFVNADFASLFGFLLGDGWISHKYHVMFALGEYNTLNDKYINLLEKFSGKKASFVPQKKSGNRKLPFHTAFVGSKMLVTILKRMGFEGNCYTKRIPNWVFETSTEIKEAFLNGILDADGTLNIVSPKSISYTIELANEQLIKDIRTLAQSLGYRCGKIGERNRVGRLSEIEGEKPIACMHTSYYLSFYKDSIKETKKTKKELISDVILAQEVKSIVHVGQQETFDISVENENENFFANGIVTHNCSYLNKARRHWRMLSLMEDMMLIYRLERSIERRVYKIYVGAIDEADVPAYVEEIANNFKRTPIIDPMTGQIDLRKNIMAVDQDIFLPVRDPNAATPIDTLSAAQNLTAMDDIKFVQQKVFTALRIPASFLNFEDGKGEGQNLALMDIRFTRTINRIQQAFLMELTKVASIHLYLLGFEDELTNFSLSMTNPSTQAEQLQIDNLTKKIASVRDAVSDPGNGIPVMSLQRALKEIMKWSDKDIQENFEELRLEKALASELEKTTQIIKKTGIFDVVDKIYGEPGATYQDGQQQGGDEMGGMPGGGGMGAPPMGGGDLGGDLDGMDMEGAPQEGEISGEEGEIPMDGGEMPQDEGAPPMESVSNKKPLLVEERKISDFNKRNQIEVKRAEIYNDAFLVNEEFNDMINSLGEFLKD